MPKRDDSSGDIASRSRLIIGLLIMSLVLVIALAWQAQRATTTHLQTATGVLQDYGRMVADVYARRAMGDIGYYGYFTYVNHLRSHAEISDQGLSITAPEPGSPAERAAQLAGPLFVYDVANNRLDFSDRQTANTAVLDFLVGQARAFSGEALPDMGLSILHYKDNGQSQTFVMTATDDRAHVFGFEVDRHRLSEWLATAFEREALLPQSLAGGAVTNDSVYLRMIDDSEQVVFETGPAYDPYLRVSKQLGDDYQGIFSNYTLSTAIDPDAADALVIGGLPRSRLPLLAVVILLTVGLLITAIRQLQRERSVMRMRTNFVSEVSHELRTPLTQIRMFTETLLFDRVRSDNEKQHALEVINRESQRLIHLVENVLQFANRPGARRRLRLTEQKLAPLLERVVSEFQPLADGAKANIECDLAPSLTASVDGDALRQVLLNLLDNAIKYGPEGQHIRIALKQKGSRIRITVSDEGPGIPREDHERIFGGYYRLKRERDSAIAGTGIGLAVVRQLVIRHGGKTWVEQAPAGGAAFVIELPAPRQGDTVSNVSAGGSAAPEKPA